MNRERDWEYNEPEVNQSLAEVGISLRKIIADLEGVGPLKKGRVMGHALSVEGV